MSKAADDSLVDGALPGTGGFRLGSPEIAHPMKQNVATQPDSALRAFGAGWRSTGGFAAGSARFERLRPAVDTILRQSGVPTELAAVMWIESGGRATALSPKGALGLWQLMPATARRYGLRVDHTEDDRVDVRKSTRAAAQYLHDLHLQFGSWSLAVAAYNTGEQNLQRAINRGGSTDFSVLSTEGLLPTETRNYVPRVMAAIAGFGQPLASDAGPARTKITTVFASSSP